MMKKWIALLLALVMCLPLAGCGKSEAVKAVEALIKPLGELTEENKADYFAANAAYQALSEEEQGKVKGRKGFYEQLDGYFAQSLVGEWYPFDLYLDDMDRMEHPRYGMTINADGTMQMEHPFDGTHHGQWSLENGVLTITGIPYIATENECCSYVNDQYPMLVSTDSGTERLQFEDWLSYARPEDYKEMLSEIIKIVDLSAVDLTEYFDIAYYEFNETDEFGAHTGYVYDKYYLQSKLFDQGWYYYSVSEDFAVELCHPAHTDMAYKTDGSTDGTPNEREVGCYTQSYAPFCRESAAFTALKRSPYMVIDCCLTVDDISFGRAKGKIYYINEKYVKEVRKNEYNSRILILDVEQYPFFGWDQLNSGNWEEDNQRY